MRMMKKLIYISILASTLCLASCQEDEAYTPPVNSSTEVITFSTPYYARSAQMRNGEFKQGDQVGVLGYCISRNSGTDYSASDWNTKKDFCRPDVFYNQQLTYSSNNGMWDYTWSDTWEGLGNVGNLHPWHTNENYTYSFFAYYPYVEVSGWNNTGTIRNENSESMGTITLSGENVAGDPTITYTMPHNTDADTDNELHWDRVPDFMLAYVTDHRKANGSVRMNFRHLFCAFEFEVNNYNPYPVTINRLAIKGGVTTGGWQQQIESGFYRSLSVTGQQSDYTVDTDDLYVGQFDLVSAYGSGSIKCPEATYHMEEELPIVDNPSTTPITDSSNETIALLFIPNAAGKLTSDGNNSLRIDLSVATEQGDITVNNRTMNLVNTIFQPGVRNIFSINIVGNDLYLQMRSDGTWENDGDSDIVFE